MSGVTWYRVNLTMTTVVNYTPVTVHKESPKMIWVESKSGSHHPHKIESSAYEYKRTEGEAVERCLGLLEGIKKDLDLKGLRVGSQINKMRIEKRRIDREKRGPDPEAFCVICQKPLMTEDEIAWGKYRGVETEYCFGCVYKAPL